MKQKNATTAATMTATKIVLLMLSVPVPPFVTYFSRVAFQCDADEKGSRKDCASNEDGAVISYAPPKSMP